MKHKKIEIIPAHPEETVSHLSCDICKRLTKGKGSCDINETEISFKDVEMAYPECGKGTTYSYDICHECFVKKVMTALSELGAEPTITEWDY